MVRFACGVLARITDAMCRSMAQAKPWLRKVCLATSHMRASMYSFPVPAAWKFKADINASWDLAVINPPYVYGPPINEVKEPQALGTSQKMLFDILTGAYSQEQYETTDFQFIDVRDVAEAHVSHRGLVHRALAVDEPPQQRR